MDHSDDKKRKAFTGGKSYSQSTCTWYIADRIMLAFKSLHQERMEGQVGRLPFKNLEPQQFAVALYKS